MERNKNSHLTFRPGYFRAALLGFYAFASLSAAAAHAGQWGPWSTNSDTPVLLTRADKEAPRMKQPAGKESGIAATPFIWLLHIYQNFISPVKGDRCPMYPTCSAYSVQAVQKHGPIIGIVMTADRLIHESDEPSFVPRKKVGDRYRYIDPLENNDFWWYKK
jgi:putative membrane protein insertion efficiency factor